MKHIIKTLGEIEIPIEKITLEKLVEWKNNPLFDLNYCPGFCRECPFDLKGIFCAELETGTMIENEIKRRSNA